jgi:predicted nucleotidyltransferase
MLQQLISSKVRVKLLTLFFTNPDTRLFLREIQRQIGEDISGIKRELDNLEFIALFTTEKVGNLKYYSLNKSFSLFDELKSIIFKTTGIEGLLKEALTEFPGLEFAFIYGSYALGKESATSDIDLFLIGKINISKLNLIINSLEDKLKREINYTVYSREEYLRKKREKDGFVTGLLKNKKILIKGSQDEL